jgi:hypothetical protein
MRRRYATCHSHVCPITGMVWAGDERPTGGNSRMARAHGAVRARLRDHTEQWTVPCARLVNSTKTNR